MQAIGENINIFSQQTFPSLKFRLSEWVLWDLDSIAPVATPGDESPSVPIMFLLQPAKFSPAGENELPEESCFWVSSLQCVSHGALSATQERNEESVSRIHYPVSLFMADRSCLPYVLPHALILATCSQQLNISLLNFVFTVLCIPISWSETFLAVACPHLQNTQ